MVKKTDYVPVFVDKATHSQEFKMIRFTYFYVEYTDLHSATYLEGIADMPFLIVDMEGVIVSGLGGKTYLDTPDAIVELFDFIHEKTPYVIGTSYLWLQEELLQKYIEKKLSRGDVLRVYTPLFLQACAHLNKPREVDMSVIPSDVQAVYFSKEETTAFKKWSGQTIERIKKRYREQPKMNLRERQKRREG